MRHSTYPISIFGHVKIPSLFFTMQSKGPGARATRAPVGSIRGAMLRTSIIAARGSERDTARAREMHIHPDPGCTLMCTDSPAASLPFCAAAPMSSGKCLRRNAYKGMQWTGRGTRAEVGPPTVHPKQRAARAAQCKAYRSERRDTSAKGEESSAFRTIPLLPIQDSTHQDQKILSHIVFSQYPGAKQTPVRRISMGTCPRNLHGPQVVRGIYMGTFLINLHGFFYPMNLHGLQVVRRIYMGTYPINLHGFFCRMNLHGLQLAEMQERASPMDLHGPCDR